MNETFFHKTYIQRMRIVSHGEDNHQLILWFNNISCVFFFGCLPAVVQEKKRGERKKKMNKSMVTVAVLSLAILASIIVTPLSLAAPPIKRPMNFYEATIEGGSPQSVDYSWAYDTASGEIIFNTMDTLIMFNAEHTDQYNGSIAASWSIVNFPGDSTAAFRQTV